jgi:hypothetical protein
MSLTGAAIRILPPRVIRLLYRIRYGERLVGMTSLDEQRYYSECAAAVSGREGAIVDLGCWMCSTAISLARGVREAGAEGAAPANRIYAFDKFIWQEWMNRYLPVVSGDYSPGESFYEEARGRVVSYSSLIEVIQVDLTSYEWRGGPIKLLLVDAMKSWDLASAIVGSFYRQLREGSVLIHQDFKHYYTPWIHVIQYRLRDYFEPLFDVRNGGTLAFRTLQALPGDAAARAVEFAGLTEAEVASAIEHSTGLVSERGRPAIAAAHVMYFVHANRLPEARELLERYRTQGMRIRGELARARRDLTKAAG